MKTTLSTQAYQWTDDDGALHVGRLVVDEYDREIRRDCETVPPSPVCYTCTLIRHAHTGELEFVPWGKLSVYPSEEIPTP